MLMLREYSEFYGNRVDVLEEILADRLESGVYDLANRYLKPENADRLSKAVWRVVAEATDDAQQMGMARLFAVDGTPKEPVSLNELVNILSAYAYTAALTAFRMYLIAEDTIEDDAPEGQNRCLHNVILSELMDYVTLARDDFELYCRKSHYGQSWKSWRRQNKIEMDSPWGKTGCEA